MNHDTDANPGEAPDAVDRLRGRRKRLPSLPGPRPESNPPALRAPSPTIEPSAARTPAAEVSLSPKYVYVTVELPGAPRDAPEIAATDRMLTIGAKRLQGPPHHLEVALPAAVEPESVKATYRNGILDVTLARARRFGGGGHGA